MLRYLVKRFLQCLLVLVGVSVLVFLLVRLSPGDPVKLMLGDNYDEEVAEVMRHKMHLDEPLPAQYGHWMRNVIRGDLGESYFSGEPVADMIASRMPSTMILSVMGILIAIVVAIPLGMVSAVRRGSVLDSVCRVVSMLGISMPVFWLGLILLLVFCLKLRWLPATGSLEEYGFKAFLMPSIVLGLSTAALVTRMTRSSVLEVLGQDYVRTARAKGLPGRVVLYKHALKNAILPVITVIGMEFGSLLGGAVVTETVFSIPGIGRLLVQSIFWRDYPLVQGNILVITVAFALVNFTVDLLYATLDPRIRYS